MKSLLVVALLADAGCWTAPPPRAESPATRAPAPHGTAPPDERSPESACTEAGDRLVLQLCNDREVLTWTVTNRTSSDLWAFVAPASTKRGTFDRANVNVTSEDGHVVLSKREPPAVGGERHWVAAVRLAPAESDTGAIPLGARIDRAAPNVTGAKVVGNATIITVTLEVAFAEARANDRTTPTQPAPFIIVLKARAPQESVRGIPVPWR